MGFTTVKEISSMLTGDVFVAFNDLFKQKKIDVEPEISTKLRLKLNELESR